ncbi:chemotaxis protein CheB [bacterium]|nr:chemotaxis protein CheB [bacterium]
MRPNSIVIIGASGGGPRALNMIFTGLPSLAGSIIVVQQMPKYINASFCESLNQLTEMNVIEAADETPLNEGCVYIAPSEKHIQITKNRMIHLFNGDKVNWACPSVDVLMKSIEWEPPMRVIGIILSGLGQDGAEGIKHLKKIGGFTIAQDESSAAIYGMPKSAVETNQIDWQLTPEQIRLRLIHLVGRRQ